MIAGILAIIAAVAGGLFVLNQTNASERQAKKNLRKQYAATRAVLPLALDSIYNYAQDVAVALEKFRPILTSAGASKAWVDDLPSLDTSAIGIMRDMILSAEEEVGDRLAIIISDIQILKSRINSIGLPSPSGNNLIISDIEIDGHIIKAASIAARINDLFGYARQESNVAPQPHPSLDSLLNSLQILGFEKYKHPKIFEIAEARAKSWNEMGASAPLWMRLRSRL